MIQQDHPRDQEYFQRIFQKNNLHSNIYDFQNETFASEGSIGR